VFLHLEHVRNRWRRPKSPAHSQATIVLERLSGQTFGEEVRALIHRLYFDELELIGMGPEPMPLHQEVLRAVGNPMVPGQQQRALIVFKYAGLYTSGYVVIMQ